MSIFNNSSQKKSFPTYKKRSFPITRLNNLKLISTANKHLKAQKLLRSSDNF
jgi:hypothetical protein